MLKFLFLFFIIIVSLSASSLNDFTLKYVRDTNNSYHIEQIKKMSFKEINHQSTFAGSLHTTWYKINIYNPREKELKLFLHNNYAYYSKKIIVYEFMHNSLIRTTNYNILDSSNNPLVGSALVHPLTISPQSEMTLYIKNTPMLSNMVNFKLFDKHRSMLSISNQTFFSDFITFVLIALALYNLFLYLFNRKKEFIFYAFYLLNGALGLFFMYGSIFNHLNIYGKGMYYFSINIMLVTLFLSLFIKIILEVKVLHKELNFLFNTLIVLAIANIFIAVFKDLILAITISKIIFLYSFIIIIYLSYYLFKTQHHLAKIFLLAYFTYIVGTVISILAFSALIPLTDFTFHASGAGLVFESLIFSYLLHQHIRILEAKVRQQRELIITKNKKAQMGDMISAITHQWKQPLSRIASITSLMDFKLGQGSTLTPKEIQEKLTHINSNVLFLSQTIDDFKDFFDPHSLAEETDISDIINHAIALSKDDSLSNEISFKTDLHFESKFLIHKNELLHIILNIIQNAKEAFKRSEEKTKIIKIFASVIDNKITIDVTDNAGGIEEENLPFIFKENYTSKKNKSGSGLGLYLCKVILEEHLKGSIEVKNIENGTMFRIII